MDGLSGVVGVVGREIKKKFPEPGTNSRLEDRRIRKQCSAKPP